MTAEQTLFLALLRDHLHGELSAAIPPETDWQTLLETARAQSLQGLCYVQLKRLAEGGAPIPAETLEQFKNAFHSEVYYAANRQAEMERVLAAFARAGIDLLPFKGWIVKEDWPEPYLRTMGDVDLLIRAEDRRASDAILQELGFQKTVTLHAVWTYWEKDVTLEVHDHMFYEALPNRVDYQAYFDKAWDYAGGELWPSFHFVFLLAHAAKHIIVSGLGFRAFLDLALNARREDLDWKWIEEELEQLQLLPFAKTCRALCQAWFEGDVSPMLDREFFENATEKLFCDGTFGLQNEQNREAGAAKELLRSRWGYWTTALMLTLRKLFPPYREMQLIPWYAFVDGRPWLMPAAWVYRWAYCMVHKRKMGGALLAQPFAKRKQIEQRQALICDWHLAQEGERK